MKKDRSQRICLGIVCCSHYYYLSGWSTKGLPVHCGHILAFLYTELTCTSKGPLQLHSQVMYV